MKKHVLKFIVTHDDTAVVFLKKNYEDVMVTKKIDIFYTSWYMSGNEKNPQMKKFIKAKRTRCEEKTL